jgi:transcriptional regulator with XRE-family HTH domain
MEIATLGPTAIHDLETLGAALREARRDIGYTQLEAANLSGVSVRLWNETELGKRRQLGLDTILRMLNTMGIDLLVARRGAAHATDSKPAR